MSTFHLTKLFQALWTLGKRFLTQANDGKATGFTGTNKDPSVTWTIFK